MVEEEPDEERVQPRGEDVLSARIKIIDFGLSRALQELAPDRLTRVGFTVGTPMYMAPEQALGDERADHRIDLFSMGVTLYEMLTTRLPFEGASNTVVLARVLGATPRPPRELRPEIPAALEAVVLRALEKDPARRYGDASELREALLQAAREEWDAEVAGTAAGI